MPLHPFDDAWSDLASIMPPTLPETPEESEALSLPLAGARAFDALFEKLAAPGKRPGMDPWTPNALPCRCPLKKLTRALGPTLTASCCGYVSSLVLSALILGAAFYFVVNFLIFLFGFLCFLIFNRCLSCWLAFSNKSGYHQIKKKEKRKKPQINQRKFSYKKKKKLKKHSSCTLYRHLRFIGMNERLIDNWVDYLQNGFMHIFPCVCLEYVYLGNDPYTYGRPPLEHWWSR